MSVDAEVIRRYIADTFEGVQAVEDEGSWFFFYDSDNKIPFATVVTSNRYDSHSGLDRPGAYRLNIGIGKETFRTMFPIEEKPLDAGFDFTVRDRLMPHPDYGRTFWVCVVEPGEESWANSKRLLSEAYQLAVRKFETARSARLKG